MNIRIISQNIRSLGISPCFVRNRAWFLGIFISLQCGSAIQQNTTLIPDLNSTFGPVSSAVTKIAESRQFHYTVSGTDIKLSANPATGPDFITTRVLLGNSLRPEFSMREKGLISFVLPTGDKFAIRETFHEGSVEVDPLRRGFIAFADKEKAIKTIWTPYPGGAEEWVWIKPSGRDIVLEWRLLSGFFSAEGDTAYVHDDAGKQLARLRAPASFVKSDKGVEKIKTAFRAQGAKLQLIAQMGNNTTDVLIDPIWEIGPNMSVARTMHTSTLLADGRVLVAGGISYSQQAQDFAAIPASEIFDNNRENTLKGDWLPAGQLNQGRFNHTATLLRDGRVIVTGGGIGNLFQFDGTECNTQSVELYSPQANTWSSGPDLLVVALSHHTANLLNDGRLIVAGGLSHPGCDPDVNSWRKEVQIFNPTTNTWQIANPMLINRGFHTSTLLKDGMLLVVGGSNGTNFALDSVEKYDPVTNTWTLKKNLPFPLASHTATLLQDGRVLVAGGVSTGNNSNIIIKNLALIYDPAADQWSQSSAMSAPRAYHSANLLPDGRVVVTGGSGDAFGDNSFLWVNTAEKFNPASGQWELPVDMSNFALYHPSVLLPTNRLLIAGGRTKGQALSATQIFDVSEITQVPGYAAEKSQCPKISAHSSTHIAEGKVLVAGGFQNGAPSEKAYIYDTATNLCTMINAMSTTRVHHTALRLQKNRVLVTGGMYDADQQNFQKNAEIYDLDTGSWQTTKNIQEPRAAHTMNSLAKGQPIICGGRGAAGVLKSCEIYDSNSNSWVLIAGMNYGRRSHTMTKLADGQLFAIGGLDNADQLIMTTEKYDEPTNTWKNSADLNLPRASHTATLLPSNIILVAGGGTKNGPTNNIEFYFPNFDKFFTGNPDMPDSGPHLNIARMGHTATLLPNGKVVFVGGMTYVVGLNTFLPVIAVETWTSGMPYETNVAGKPFSALFRYASHTATLLDTGEILLLGSSIDPEANSRINEGRGVTDTSLIPEAIFSFPSSPGPGDQLTIQGTKFSLPIEGGNGGSNTSSVNYPITQFIAQGNEMTRYGAYDINWMSLKTSVQIPKDLLPGWYQMRIIRGGIPAVAKYIYIQ